MPHRIRSSSEEEDRNPMASPLQVLLLLIACLSSSSLRVSASKRGERETAERSVGQRLLLGFIETPRGSNRTFECSPSGPCVPCLYSEKNDEKYRCSETGYRIPLKCVEIDDGSKDENEQKTEGRSTLEISVNGVKPPFLLHDSEDLTTIKHRSLLDASSTSEDKSKTYVTYRSCILSVNEEKLSVIGFESIVLCLLLISGSVVYFRKKRTVAMPGVGAGRIQGNSRF